MGERIAAYRHWQVAAAQTQRAVSRECGMNLVPDSLTASGEAAAIPPDFNINFFQEASCCHHA
jgi:hypothetical protein